MKPIPIANAPVAPSHVPLRDFLLLHGTLFLYAIISLLGKYAGLHFAVQQNTEAFIFLGLEFFSLVVYAMLWQQTLKRMPLSFAYSNKAVCTLWTYLFGIVLLGEQLTWGKAAGILLVLAGVWLVVSARD